MDTSKKLVFQMSEMVSKFPAQKLRILKSILNGNNTYDRIYVDTNFPRPSIRRALREMAGQQVLPPEYLGFVGADGIWGLDFVSGKCSSCNSKNVVGVKEPVCIDCGIIQEIEST